MKTGTKIKISLGAAILLLNLVIWASDDFCSWYVAHVYPMSVNVLSRLTSPLPFSLGEGLAAGAVLVLCLGILLVLPAILREGWHRKLCKSVWGFISWGTLVILLLLTLNWFVLYHSDGFADTYMETSERTEDQLFSVYNLIAQKCNELSGQFDRDENGCIIYEGNLEEEAKAAMKKLGETYPRLSGYYPTPKKLIFSGFFSQQYISGIFLPYTMEANYNQIMYIANMPASLCHELSHIKGFIYEDEANFIAYLACVGSDDMFFQYSGYLSVYGYVLQDIYNNYDFGSELWQTAVRMDAQADRDRIFLTEEAWQTVEKNAIISTETVKEVSNQMTDVSLKLNGVSDGIASYSRVVELLLDYYTMQGQLQ